MYYLKYFEVYQTAFRNPAILNQDNKSTIRLAKTGRSNAEKTRHIAIRYFWIKDRIMSKEVEINYCPTDDMIAGVVTKPLTGAKFIYLRSLLLNCIHEA